MAASLLKSEDANVIRNVVNCTGSELLEVYKAIQISMDKINRPYSIAEFAVIQGLVVSRYLYEGDIVLEVEHSLKVLEAAQTYAVHGLIDKCLNLLKSNMTPNSVCRIMEIAHIHDKEELRERCLNLIIADPQKVISSGALVDLCSDCLSLILKDDGLFVDEETIYYACLRYADLKCRGINLQSNSENRRTMLGDALNAIRFPTMSHDFFTDIVQPSGLLTDSECVKVFKYFFNPQNGCDLFNTTPRNVQKKASRFLEIAKGWGYKRDKQDAITFSCSHDVVIQGVELYCVGENTANYEVNLILYQLPFYSVVLRSFGMKETNSKDKTYTLKFDQPALIERNKDYAFSLVCRGPPSYYGVKGMNVVEEDGVRFIFKPNDKSSNNTTVERGQIASILYSKISIRTN